MNKFKEIAEGWKNNVLRNDEVVEKVAEERNKICEACPHISTKHKTVRPDVHCTICLCTTAAKIRSLTTSCPIGSWSAFKLEEDEKIHDKKGPS